MSRTPVPTSILIYINISPNSSTEKGSIIFASNAVTIAVDADLRGSISVPGKPTSATVILSTFGKLHDSRTGAL